MPNYPVSTFRYRRTGGANVPGPPTLAPITVFTATSATLSITPPTVPAGGGPVQGYYVAANGIRVTTLASTDLGPTISGLTAGGTYAFTVQAYNADGPGEVSQPQSVTTTSLQAPGAPTVRFTARGADSATIAWTVPTAPDTDPVLGYRVRKNASTTILATVTTGLTTTITGLVSGDVLWVKAYNNAGQGPESNRITYTPPDTPPQPPGTGIMPKPVGIVADTYSLAMPKVVGTYSNRATTKAIFADVGVKHFRTRYKPASAETVARMVEFAEDLGVRTLARFGAYEETDAAQQTPAELVQAIFDDFGPTGARPGRRVTDYVWRFEGWNEPNNKVSKWVDRTIAYQKAMWTAIRAQSALDTIPVMGFSLARVAGNSGGMEGNTYEGQAQTAALAAEAVHGFTGYGIAPWCDEGVTHIYPRGRTPSTDLDTFTAAVRKRLYPPTKQDGVTKLPLGTTEGGYFNDMTYTTSNPTPKDVHAIYGDRHICEHVLRGSKVFNHHEVWDDTTGSREGTFGIVNADGTKKPVYATLKNFLALMSDENTDKTPKVTGFTRTALDLSVTPTPGTAGSTTNTLRMLLFQHSDGTYRLVLWRDVDVKYAATSPYKITALTPINITVALPRSMTVTEYTPSIQATATTAAAAKSSISTTLSDNLKVFVLV